MCLSDVYFALTYQDDKYIGVGYKNITLENCNSVISFNNKWQEANGDKFEDVDNLYESSCLSANAKSYIPGFHIFLDIKDAMNYCNNFVVEVLYREVLAFGLNDTVDNKELKDYSTIFRPCIVSRFMKINRVLSYYHPCLGYDCKVVDNKMTDEKFLIEEFK